MAMAVSAAESANAELSHARHRAEEAENRAKQFAVQADSATVAFQQLGGKYAEAYSNLQSELQNQRREAARSEEREKSLDVAAKARDEAYRA